MAVKKRYQRPSWDEYFLKLARVVRERSNCLRMSVGVVLVKEKRIIATGYNGTPAGVKNCFDGGCERCLHRHQNKIGEHENKEFCICVHSEQNAIYQSAYHGVSTKGAKMYATVSPCITCAKAIISAGIVEFVFEDDHTYDEGVKLLKSARVKVQKVR